MRTSAPRLAAPLALGPAAATATVWALVAAGSGCAGTDEEFRKAVPTAEQVTIAVPAAARPSGQSLGGVGVTSSGLLGQPAEFYGLSVAVSAAVNASALAILGVLHLIVEQPPTSVDPHSRTWGPFTPGGLDPLTYRATVTRLDPSDFTYAIVARPRASQSEADYLPLLDGTLTRTLIEGRGRGTAVLHFDNGRALRPLQCEQGTIRYAFDNSGPTATLAVTLTRFANANPRGVGCLGETPHDGSYLHDRNLDGSGDFVFALQTNIHRADEHKPLLEDVTVRSRWLASGAGRADVKIAGGEVQADLVAARLGQDFVAASQCWGPAFTTTYESSTPEALHLIATAGNPSTCSFTSQQLP